MQLSLTLDEPRARSFDASTSHAAASAARSLQAQHADQILACLRKHGAMGKDGIAARTKLDGVQVCRRLVELERAGLAATTGKTVPSTSGRAEREWAAA
jgi:predicted ArsR family transcriptional regulator